MADEPVLNIDPVTRRPLPHDPSQDLTLASKGGGPDRSTADKYAPGSAVSYNPKDIIGGQTNYVPSYVTNPTVTNNTTQMRVLTSSAPLGQGGARISTPEQIRSSSLVSDAQMLALQSGAPLSAYVTESKTSPGIFEPTPLYTQYAKNLGQYSYSNLAEKGLSQAAATGKGFVPGIGDIRYNQVTTSNGGSSDYGYTSKNLYSNATSKEQYVSAATPLQLEQIAARSNPIGYSTNASIVSLSNNPPTPPQLPPQSQPQLSRGFESINKQVIAGGAFAEDVQKGFENLGYGVFKPGTVVKASEAGYQFFNTAAQNERNPLVRSVENLAAGATQYPQFYLKLPEQTGKLFSASAGMVGYGFETLRTREFEPVQKGAYSMALAVGTTVFTPAKLGSLNVFVPNPDFGFQTAGAVAIGSGVELIGRGAYNEVFKPKVELKAVESVVSIEGQRTAPELFKRPIDLNEPTVNLKRTPPNVWVEPKGFVTEKPSTLSLSPGPGPDKIIVEGVIASDSPVYRGSYISKIDSVGEERVLYDVLNMNDLNKASKNFISNPKFLESHGEFSPDPVQKLTPLEGIKVIDLQETATGPRIKLEVTNPSLISDIERGTYSGFSIGFTDGVITRIRGNPLGESGVVPYYNFKSKINIFELSFVDAPASRGSFFNYYRTPFSELVVREPGEIAIRQTRYGSGNDFSINKKLPIGEELITSGRMRGQIVADIYPSKFETVKTNIQGGLNRLVGNNELTAQLVTKRNAVGFYEVSFESRGLNVPQSIKTPISILPSVEVITTGKGTFVPLKGSPSSISLEQYSQTGKLEPFIDIDITSGRRLITGNAPPQRTPSLPNSVDITKSFSFSNQGTSYSEVTKAFSIGDTEVYTGTAYTKLTQKGASAPLQIDTVVVNNIGKDMRGSIDTDFTKTPQEAGLVQYKGTKFKPPTTPTQVISLASTSIKSLGPGEITPSFEFISPSAVFRPSSVPKPSIGGQTSINLQSSGTATQQMFKTQTISRSQEQQTISAKQETQTTTKAQTQLAKEQTTIKPLTQTTTKPPQVIVSGLQSFVKYGELRSGVRVSGAQISLFGSSQTQSSRFGFVSSLSQSTRQALGQSTDQVVGQSQIQKQLTSQLQRTAQAQRTATQTRTSTRQLNPTITPPTPPPTKITGGGFLPIPIPNIDDRRRRNQTDPLKDLSHKGQYNPSFTAKVFNIVGKPGKSELTGFGLRPVLPGRRGKR